MKFQPIMKWHRAFQLIGLYGVLFLLPVLQQSINDLGSAKEEAQRRQTYVVVEHLYSDVKQLVCQNLGQEATTHDCKKGIFQDERLNFALDDETKIDENHSRLMSVFRFIYYIFAICAFMGNYIEYRQEYKNLIGARPNKPL